MRILFGTGLVLGGIVAAACSGQSADLGGKDGGVAVANGGPDAGAGSGVDAGFSGQIPLGCNEADGTPRTFSSTQSIAQAVVGTWFDCGASGTSILVALGGSTDSYAGLQLTADGHYSVLTNRDNGDDDHSTPSTDTLSVTLTGPDGGTNNVPLVGTYAVLDASATLGPSTYQIRFDPATGPATGGSFLAQVLLLASPTKLRFVFSAGPSTEEFAPAISLGFRVGTCNYFSFGTEYSFTSTADVAARLEGSWIWCAGPPFGEGPLRAAGVVFPGDGTWNLLQVDGSGKLVRASTVVVEDGGTIASQGVLQIYGIGDAGFGTSVGIPVLSTSGLTLGFLEGAGPIDDQPILQKSAASY